MQRSSLALALCLTLAACGDGDATSDASEPDGGPPWWLDAGPPPFDGGAAMDAAEPPDSGLPPAPRGLVRLAQVEHPRPGPHLGEITPWNDVVYVANSWDELTALRLEPDGGLLITLVRPALEDMGRCTTLAIHEPSHTMYCSSEEPSLRAYDITDPETPVNRMSAALPPGQALRTRDLAVIDNVLYIAAFDRGLHAAPLGPDGSVGAPSPTGVTGNVRFVAGNDPIVALSSDRGLLVLDGTGAATSVARELALDGTPQDLSVRGDRAIVALGSAGVAVVDLAADPLRIVAEVHPLAVATGADLDGDTLAVTTLTGAYLYDLGVSPPRLAGFAPSGRTGSRNHGVMLSGRFHRGELLTSDWVFIERYAVDPTGDAIEPDLARGVYVRPGTPARIPARNETDLLIELRTVGVTGPDTLVLASGESGTLEIAFEDILGLREERGRSARIAAVAFRALDRATPIALTEVSIAVRAEADDPPRGWPAPGDPFPTVAVANAVNTVSHLPMMGRRTRVAFYTPDCAAMWPVLEDLAYLTRTGALDDRATAVFLTQHNSEWDGYVARFGLAGALHFHHGYLAPPEVPAENGSETLYEDRFQLHAIGSAAAHPTDYLVDPFGRVEAVETFYRGAYPLR